MKLTFEYLFKNSFNTKRRCSSYYLSHIVYLLRQYNNTWLFLNKGRLVTTTKQKEVIGKGYKIGSDDKMGTFPVTTQPYCKLKIIEQNVFDLAVKFLKE